MIHDPHRTELYRAFIGKRQTDYYLNRFASFDGKGGLFHPSWNWAAFFFSAIWALYRKLYMAFFVMAFFLIFVGLGVLVHVLALNLSLLALDALIPPLCMIIFGAYGNALYYKRTKREITKAQARAEDDQQLLSQLKARGGVDASNARGFASVLLVGSLLAAIGLPAYWDFKVRASVSEAPSLSGAAKTAVDVAYKKGFTLGALPSQTSLGLAAPASYSSKYVQSVSVDREGIVTVSLTDNRDLSSAANGTVIYIPMVEGGELVWLPACSFANKWCPRR